MTQANLSYCAAEVQRLDRPRFLTALFAPSSQREDLFALYAFNLEIAKILETVTEPMLGRIRLQWWRETIEGIYGGRVRQHAVASALAGAIERHALPRDSFDRLIDARESDLDEEPPADSDALKRYAEASAGMVAALAARIVTRDGADAAATAVGLAHGLSGLLLALPFRIRQGRLDLPQDRLAAAGLSLTRIRDGKGGGALVSIVAALAEEAGSALAQARQHRRAVPRAALPALLVGTVAERQLKRLADAGYDPFSGALRRPDAWLPAALAWASWRGRY